MEKAIVIVAGGSGSRMKSDTPKQFIEWCGKPILMHTINVFYSFDSTIKIVLVLPEEQIKLWENLKIIYDFNIPVIVTCGGETRFHSVRNGLSKLSGDLLVGIHDGVRPLVSHGTLNRCFTMAEELGNAIPIIDSYESVRHVTKKVNKLVNRNEYKLVQTPQVFVLNDLKDAYKQEYCPIFTDDASVMENAGFLINLAEGNRENIKITTPIDLLIGKALCNGKV